MANQKTFIHTFVDDGGLSIDTDAIPPASIKLELETDGNFWLIANREGWLHLARVCSEMGLSAIESGYHFHKNATFQFSTSAPEFTFMRNDELSSEASGDA